MAMRALLAICHSKKFGYHCWLVQQRLRVTTTATRNLCVDKALATLSALLLGLSAARGLAQHPQPHFLEIPAATLEDKIRGGMLAQVIGNLNGLPHEFKYINEPGHVERFTPSLPTGAFTDDDTDIEWVYLRAISESGNILLPNADIAALWKRHINRRIFCANRYARDLMDLGLEPPWTGNVALNPWSDFNISGQFICESFGLMAPAMPRTAARIGLHCTHVAIDGEPAQATQLFTTMIATAFIENDIDRILDAGEKAVDRKSRIADVVATTRGFCAANPNDWRKARLAMKERWQTRGGAVRDRNGYELNTACVVAALYYGHGDFIETLRTAFNLGWDADCDGATAATIVGVIKGRHWMNAQGWKIKDVYRNTTRDDMPNDETLTGLEDLCIQAARITIIKNGGKHLDIGAFDDNGHRDTDSIYQIRTQEPANIEPLATAADQLARVRKEFGPRLKTDLASSGSTRARAAFIAICLGETNRMKSESPKEWSAAVAELQTNYPKVVHSVFKAPTPAGDPLRHAAELAGLHDPKDLKLTERPLEDK
jgi:ADP-ribosylglycohydrolase